MGLVGAVEDGGYEEMDTLAEKNPYIKKTVGRVMAMSEDQAARMIAEAREKARMDEIARIRYGEMKGLEQGHREVALNMKKLGADNIFIAKATGLSEAEVEKL